jgi:hypothetical protein
MSDMLLPRLRTLPLFNNCSGERTSPSESLYSEFSHRLYVALVPNGSTDTAPLLVTLRAVQVDQVPEQQDKTTQYCSEHEQPIARMSDLTLACNAIKFIYFFPTTAF